MRVNRCAAGCKHCHGVSRRDFLGAASASLAGASLWGAWPGAVEAAFAKIRQQGPAATFVPTVKACFVRRQGDYGLRWPGAIYDGEAARKKYTALLQETAAALKIKLDLRPQPVYTQAEADHWLAEAKAKKADGLLVALLDRQEHAWPTAGNAIDSKIPTVVFAPVGAAFTTNTEPQAKKTGCFLCATDDFSQVRWGMKMLRARAKMLATRCLVIAGRKTLDTEMPGVGIKLRYIPAQTFLDEYQKTPESNEVQAMAKELMAGAKHQVGATPQDVLNGIKSYVVARKLLEREKADAISMDCLGALGKTKVSLPCIAWSKMNDDGIPAACEADLGAVATHVVVQYLFDRPGFQQDPVPETARDAVIGAHCSCPTRLEGFGSAPEPYDIVHHHAARDATARPVWKIGQRVTSADVIPGPVPKMFISAGSVLANVAAPPAGGCVVSVMVKFDGSTDVLSFPGFHQIFFYGDFKRELVQFCRLARIEPVVA